MHFERGGSQGLFQNTLPAFVWTECRKPRETSMNTLVTGTRSEPGTPLVQVRLDSLYQTSRCRSRISSLTTLRCVVFPYDSRHLLKRAYILYSVGLPTNRLIFQNCYMPTHVTVT
jgi:hypothetical protein